MRGRIGVTSVTCARINIGANLLIRANPVHKIDKRIENKSKCVVIARSMSAAYGAAASA